MTGKFAGKVAMVTGAARGQGRAHALRLAEEGADVIVLDICTDVTSVPYAMATVDDLEETSRLIEKLDRRVVAAVADVSDRDALRAVVDSAVGELGGLDLVSINAGICTPAGLLDITPAQWNDTLGTNLTGAFNSLQVSVPHIIAGGRGGSVVLTSSSVAMKPAPNLADYISSKHGVIGLTRAAALELAPHNIRVNSVHPGMVDTPMIQNTRFRTLFAPDIDEPTADDLAAVTSNFHALPIPWVEAVDISNAVAFLLSDDARYITGVQLPIDGGGLLL